MKRGSRRYSGTPTSGDADNTGFNAKTLKNASAYDAAGERKMRLNNKPIVPAGAIRAPVKKQSLGLRASLHRIKSLETPETNDLTRNLMDDQSVASFGITGSSKYGIHPDIAEALALNEGTRNNDLTKSTSSTSMGDPLSLVPRYGMKPKMAAEKLHGSWSESSSGLTEKMFDDFTIQRRSSVTFSGGADPFGTLNAIATNGEDDSDDKPPLVQRACILDDDLTMDDSSPSEYPSESTGGRDPIKPKKSKMQKIGELLIERKQWSMEKRSLHIKMMAQAERIARLEKEKNESGYSSTRAEAAMAEKEEELNKLTRELELSWKETKLAKSHLLAKKSEMLSKDKELEANASEISSLRKELSQALQQVDILEEELESDKTRILTLTNGLLGSEDYSLDDVETRQEQQESFERELKKKDRKIESQRMEVNKQFREILRLKTDLEETQKQARKNEALIVKITQLTEAKNETNSELEKRERELGDLKRNVADLKTKHAATIHHLERELQRSSKTLSSATRATGRDGESLESQREDLRTTTDALSQSQRSIETITSENQEALDFLKKTIRQLEEKNLTLQSQLAQVDPHMQTKINDLQQMNEDLERELKFLKQSLERDKKESEKLQSKLTAQITTLRSSLEASQNLNKQSEDETTQGVSALQARLSQTEMALEEMKRYNEDLEASVDELRETSADFELELSRLQEERKEQVAKSQALAEELKQANETASMLQSRLVEVQEHARVLEMKSQNLEQKVTLLAEENEHLQESAEEIEEDRHAVAALEDLMDEYDDLQDEVQSLRESVSTLEAELEEVKQANLELKTSVDRAEKKVKETQHSLTLAEGAQTELQLLRRESNDLRCSFVELQRKFEAINAEGEELRAKSDKASCEQDNYVITVAELHEERRALKAIEDEAESLRDFKKSAQLQISELTGERDKWINSASVANESLALRQIEVLELQNSNREFSALRDVVDAHGAQIKSLGLERDEFRIAAAEAEEKAQKALVALEDLMEDFELLQAETETLEKEKIELESRHAELEKERGEMDLTARGALSQAATANVELESLQRQLKSREQDSSELAQKNTNLTTRVAELQVLLDGSIKRIAKAEAKAADAEDLARECGELQGRIEIMESESRETRGASDELVLKMRLLEADIAKSTRASVKAKTELEEEVKRSRYLEKNLNDKVMTQKAVGQNIERDVKTLSEITNLRILKSQLESEITDLTAKRDELTIMNVAPRGIDLDPAAASNSITRGVDDELRHQLEGLQNENKRLAESIAELDQERNQLVEKNMEVQMQLAERDSTLASIDEAKRARISVQAELDALRNRYSSIDKKVESLTTDRDHWRQLAETSEHHAGEANDALIALEEQTEQQRRVERDQMNAELKNLQAQNDDMVAERTTLKDLLAKAEDGLVSQKEQMEQLLRVEDQRNVEMKNVQSQNDDLVAERTTLKDLLANAEIALHSQREQVEQLLRVECDQRNAETKTLQSQIDDLVAERTTLKDSLATAEDALLAHEKQLDQLRRVEHDHMSTEMKTLESENDDLVTERNTLKDSLAKANVALMALDEQIERLGREMHDEMTAELSALQSQNDDLVAECSKLKGSLAKAEDSFVASNEQIEELRRVNLEQTAAEVSLKAQIDDLVRELGMVKESLVEAKDALTLQTETETKNLLSQIDDLTSERSSLMDSVAEAKDALVSKEGMEQLHRDDREKWNAEKSTLQSQVDDLVAEIMRLKDSLAKSEEMLTTSSSVISSLRLTVSELDAVMENIVILKSENAELSAQILSITDERDILKAYAVQAASRSREISSEFESLKSDHEELLSAKQEAVRLREEKSQALLQIAQLQAEFATLKTIASRAEGAENEVFRSKRILIESEQRIADLEAQYADLEMQYDALVEDRKSLLSASDVTQEELSTAQAALDAYKAIESEIQALKDANAALHTDSEVVRSEKNLLAKEVGDLADERDKFKQRIAEADEKGNDLLKRLCAMEESEKVLIDLQKQLDYVRDRLTISSSEDLADAVKGLQQDYLDVLDENDRLRDNLADMDGELAELHAEREDLILQAEERLAGASSLASRSSNDATGMQELCEELQRQLLAMTRDRDSWKETADTVARTVNKGEKRVIRTESDECSVSSARSLGTEQKMLLQQALEYRERRDGKKSAWGFSTFGVQRPAKIETETESDAKEREELIDRLTELNETYQETIKQLKSELVGLNTSLKEESYSMKKKLDAVDQENQAYELKVMALEYELERLATEAKRNDGQMDRGQLLALQRSLENVAREKDIAERQIALLQAEVDKLNRASSLDLHHKQVEIDRLQEIQKDFQAKVDALENMMNAIDQENESLRRIAQKASNFSIESDLGQKVGQDAKDVKISRLHNEMAELQLQSQLKLQEQMSQFQKEKSEMHSAMADHFQIMDEENRSILEDLEMRLKAREQTIKQLESILETVGVVGDDVMSGAASYDTRDGNSTYNSAATNGV